MTHPATAIQAQVSVTITHLSGPFVEDPDHIVAWISSTDTWPREHRHGFQFEVCSGHSHPNKCPESCGRTFALYLATITGVEQCAK